jgi:TRAP-type C4-dicarboxylate transport system substrate-binding protein
MKKACFIFIALLMVALLAMAGCAEPTPEPAPAPAPTPSPEPEPAQPIELSLTWVDMKNPLYDGSFGVWADMVEQNTNGRVKITEYYGGQLVPPPENYEAVVKGTADIGIGWIAVVPGRFPHLEVIQLATLDTKLPAPSRAYMELYQTVPEIQEDLSQTKVLAICGPSPAGASGIGLRDKEVRTLEDLKGLKIHVVGGKWESRLFEALGASPMSLMPSELYTSVQTKVIDGGIFMPEMYPSYNMWEVVQYHVRSYQLFMPMYVTMNWDSWNSLPQDIQQVFEETAREQIPDLVDSYFAESAKGAFEAADEHGLTIIDLAPEELARWVEIHEMVRDEWAAEMEAEGLPGKRLLEDWDSVCAKNSVK